MKTNLLIIFIIAFKAFAQTSGSWGFSDAASTSMGKTYAARAIGIDAIGVNPANLAVKTSYAVNFAAMLPIPSVVFTLKSPIDIDNYNYYFGGVTNSSGKVVGRPLTIADKDNLKSLIGTNSFLMNANINYLTVNYNSTPEIGSFAFSIIDKTGSDFKFAESLIDFAFLGNTLGKNYPLSEVFVKSTAYREYALSYARKITDEKFWEFEKIFGGISLKLISGFSYVATTKNNSFFEFGNKNQVFGKWDYEVNIALPPDYVTNYGKEKIEMIKSPQFSPFPTSCGSGFGFDIGFTATMLKIMTVSLAITDIGSITWNKNTATISGTGEFNFTGYSTQQAIDSLANKFKEVRNELGTSFSSSLPTTLRFGVAYQFDKAPFIKSFPGQLLLAFDYNQGFNNEVGNSTTPRFSIGAEWKPGKWIPVLRTGFSVGGAMGAEWAFGLGYEAGPLDFNFALMNPVSLFTMNTSKKVVIGFDSRWKF